MPNIKVKASELVNTDVQFVSMVDRAANRLPFRIMKKEDGQMSGLDLYELGRRMFKSEPKTPTVAVVMIAKSADVAAQVARLSKAGLDMSKPDESNDAFVAYAQPGVELKDEALFKLDKDVGLIVSNVGDSLKKAFESFDMESTTFKDVMSTEGVYPSLSMAKDMLGYTIGNILAKAENATSAASQIDSALAEFTAFVKNVVSAIPEHAFKADISVADVPVTNPDKKEHKNIGEGPANMGGDDGSIPAPTKYAPGPSNSPDNKGSKEKATADEDEKADDDEKDDEKDDKKKAKKADEPVADFGKELLAQVGEMLGVLKNDISGQLSGVTKSIEGIDTRLGTVEAAAQKMDDTITGAVVGTDNGGDRTRAKKQESRGAPPLLDTGYMTPD